MRSHFVVTRMARLTQLRVHASNAAKDRGIVPPGLRFRETTHHVTEMFVSLLGRRYSLNGSSLVQITCGPRGSDPEFYNVLGSTGVFVESFDFGAYRTMSDAEREETVLALVVDQLLRIAEREKVDPEPIRTCAAAMRHHGFVLEQEFTKLGRSLPHRRGRVRVYRQLGASFSERWVARLSNHAGGLAHEIPMRQGPLDLRGYFSRSALHEDDFVVTSSLGETTFSVPQAGLLAENPSAEPQPLRMIPL